MSCSFGGRRAALIVADGRIVIREKDVKDDIASFPPCGALSIALNGKTFMCIIILQSEIKIRHRRHNTYIFVPICKIPQEGNQ